MKRKIGNSWGVGGLYITPVEWKFQGGGGSNWKNHPWEGYGYFLESHNAEWAPSLKSEFSHLVSHVPAATGPVSPRNTLSQKSCEAEKNINKKN